MTTPEKGNRCYCCDLVHVGRGPMCSVCAYHQSDEINQRVKRHSEHAAMLRERLVASTKWAEDATAERKEMGQKMHWALRSRDRTITVLRQINDMHELRSNGSCKCGKPKNCKIADLLDDRGIQQLIRRVDEFEEEQREAERLWREIQSRDPDEWEDLIRGSGAFARRPPRGGASHSA